MSEICVEWRGSFLQSLPSSLLSPSQLCCVLLPTIFVLTVTHTLTADIILPLCYLYRFFFFSLILLRPILSPLDSFTYGYAMIPSPHPRLEAAIPTLTLSPTWCRVMSSDNIKGLVLALSSSLFIGASFIVKKKGLKKAASSGVRAGVGGYSYLYEPLWWVGMITMIAGEIANFAAYAFAPAILVTPLGALSIIISAALAHVILRERLHIFGILGCVLCVVGSATIILHAPQEREIESVTEVWQLAMDPAFLLYAALVVATAVILIIHFIPQYGQTHIMIYIGVCSLVGSLSVMSVKALGVALKLTLSGMNQLIYPQTWIFTLVVITCVLIQMNYLNKALDTFNTAVVSPIYYVMFTSLTILASVIMFKDWDRQSLSQAVTEMCGFVTILSGTFLLHKTKDMADGSMSPTSGRACKQSEEDEFSDTEGIPLTKLESSRSP